MMGKAWLLAGLVLAAPVVSAQASPATQTTIRVLVDGKPPVTLDRQALAGMPRSSVDTPAIHHEPPANWQGVALEDVLQRAGAPSGEQLRGHGMATIVRVTAADHYQVVFSLGELDPMLGNERVLLADTQDGHPLTKDGPFRLVVPGDKRPARWIHDVTTIEVTNGTTPSP
jgi:DMSO/TMAO reductase YedYZ molybdopterin-dependent catalytic subunit